MLGQGKGTAIRRVLQETVHRVFWAGQTVVAFLLRMLENVLTICDGYIIKL
jgi:hypothetical protein